MVIAFLVFFTFAFHLSLESKLMPRYFVVLASCTTTPFILTEGIAREVLVDRFQLVEIDHPFLGPLLDLITSFLLLVGGFFYC